MDVVIPMAGAGKRFYDNGYDVPKPLIDVLGKPMIQAVIENLNIDANYTFLIQTQHKQYDLHSVLRKIVPNCQIIEVDSLTQGPACTALLSQDQLTGGNLIITNCDQIIRDFDIHKLLEFSKATQADGILGAFLSDSKKNSYMKVDSNGEVLEIKEKIVISNIASNGLHFWKNSSMFIETANQMIAANERYNNEFYIAPSYNYLVKQGKKVLPYFYNLHLPIGTPEDLNKYCKIYEDF